MILSYVGFICSPIIPIRNGFLGWFLLIINKLTDVRIVRAGTFQTAHRLMRSRNEQSHCEEKDFGITMQ